MLCLVLIVTLTLPLVPCDEAISRKCHDLLTCSVKKNCIKQMYDDLDAGIDYGCIFTTGCADECTKCPLCVSSKEHLIDVLSGNKRLTGDECPELVNCATDCVKANLSRRKPLNQVPSEWKLGGPPFFQGLSMRQEQCYQIFREIVFAKFEEQFKNSGKKPAIGIKAN
uniref:Saposin B-type domain-containing protein n=1 Tax=Parascaris equorum TaxID=6256 RepID=A0A914RZV3_PAREQ